MNTPTKRAISIAEAYRSIGIGRSTFYAMLKNGQGPKTFKLGARHLIDAVEFDRWLAGLRGEEVQH